MNKNMGWWIKENLRRNKKVKARKMRRERTTTSTKGVYTMELVRLNPKTSAYPKERPQGSIPVCVDPNWKVSIHIHMDSHMEGSKFSTTPKAQLKSRSNQKTVSSCLFRLCSPVQQHSLLSSSHFHPKKGHPLETISSALEIISTGHKPVGVCCCIAVYNPHSIIIGIYTLW